MSGPFDPATEAEAADLGRAILARLRGEPLTPRQASALARGRATGLGGAVAPGPVVDREEVLLRLPRGEDTELRLTLRSFRGSDPFLDLRRFDRGPGGHFGPSRQGITIRRRELGRVLSALTHAASELLGEAPPPDRRAGRASGPPPGGEEEGGP